jgi:hypothetical protein
MLEAAGLQLGLRFGMQTIMAAAALLYVFYQIAQDGKAQMGHPMGRVLEKILTQTHPMGHPARPRVGFSGGFGAV